MDIDAFDPNVKTRKVIKKCKYMLVDEYTVYSLERENEMGFGETKF